MHISDKRKLQFQCKFDVPKPFGEGTLDDKLFKWMQVVSFANIGEKSGDPNTCQIGVMNYLFAWWRHQKEAFYTLLVRPGNSLVAGEFPSQRGQ